MSRLTPLGRPALVLLAYALFAACQSGIWNGFATHIYGGGQGDPARDAWALSAVTRQLLDTPWRPFDGNISYPSHSSVLYGDPLLGPALLVLPLRVFGANPVLLFNAATLLSLVLASGGFYLLARRLACGPSAAFLAGIVVPYTGQQMSRLIHLNLLAVPFFPFLIFGLVEFFERPRAWPALLAGTAFALQAGTSGYHAFSAVLVVLVLLAWNWRCLGGRRTWAWGAVAALPVGLVLYPYVTGFLWLRHNDAHMYRAPEVAAELSLDLTGLFVSHAYLWKWLMPGAAPFFPGLVVLILAALALRRVRHDPHVRWLVLLALAAFTLALGPEVRWRGTPLLPGPFALVQRHVPLADAMRHPYTFAVPGLMALGLLAALGLERSALARTRMGFALVLAVATAETLAPAPARKPAPTEPPAVYADLAALPPGAALELPLDDTTWVWWAAFHDVPIVNGTGAFDPDRYLGLWQLLRRASKGEPRNLEETRALAHLKTWFPIRYVVVHARGGERWQAFLDATPRSFELLRESTDGGRIYRLRRGGRAREMALAFRGDQLREGRLHALVTGPPGAQLHARFNDAALEPSMALTAERREAVWSVPRERVRHGLNLLELRVDGPAAEFDLEDAEAR